MYRNNIKRGSLISWALVIAWLAAAGAALAQSPATSPTPEGYIGRYTITSSAEFGVRGLEVNGDQEKYKSDLNYKRGFRLFDSSILIDDDSSGTKAFDQMLVQASGWGSDPSSSFRLNFDRTGLYKFDSSIRKVRYFNNLKNHVINPFQTIPTGSQRAANTLHHFGDFDLTIFPERDFRIRLGYSFNDTKGPASSNVRFQGDEFQFPSAVDTRSDDMRLGVEGTVLGFNMGVTYGRRQFRDNTLFHIDALSAGNNPASTTATINTASRQFETKGVTNFGNFFIQRTFARKLDFTGRFIYSESNSRSVELDSLVGRVSSTGNIIVGDNISVPGNAKRPQSRGDIGLTYRVTDRFRISNTFSFDQFSIGTGNLLSEFVISTTSTGGPRPDTFTSSTAWRSTSYRRLSNLIEGDYQVNNRLGFHIGYRYTERMVGVLGLDINALTGVATPRGGEEHENKTNTFIAGIKVKPMRNWAIYADFERGQADSVFTRVANNDFSNFRVRSISNFKNFSLNLSFITKDNDNPGRTIAQTNVPEFEAVANQKSRIFSGSLDWNPNAKFGVSGGYTFTKQDSHADIIVPVGTPVFPTTRFLQGISEFYMRENHFFFDVTARPIKRVSIFASYRINDDPGQGDRVTTRIQDFITSYPMKFQSPEIKLAIRLSRNIDWNLGYQYYAYDETVIRNPFLTQIFPAQNYTAHLPYTSLRIYFGRSAADR